MHSFRKYFQAGEKRHLFYAISQMIIHNIENNDWIIVVVDTFNHKWNGLIYFWNVKFNYAIFCHISQSNWKQLIC